MKDEINALQKLYEKQTIRKSMEGLIDETTTLRTLPSRFQG